MSNKVSNKKKYDTNGGDDQEEQKKPERQSLMNDDKLPVYGTASIQSVQFPLIATNTNN